MDAKIKKIKRLLNGECEDITVHNVSANWYRMNIDMDYKGDKPLDIVQITYDYKLYAMPNYMTLAKFNNLTAEQIAEEWEI